MNRHFKDSVYYVKRAGEEVRKGAETELAPLGERFEPVRERVFGPEAEPAGRVDRAKAKVQEVRSRVQRDTKRAVETGRQRLEAVRA